MGQPTSPHANPQVRELLNMALEACMAKEMDFGSGIRMKFPTQAKAKSMQNSCYTVRKRERAASCKRHEPNHQNYNTSPWDPLSFKIEVDHDGQVYLKIWIPTLDVSQVEIL
jgi:hypothetical protein